MKVNGRTVAGIMLLVICLAGIRGTYAEPASPDSLSAPPAEYLVLSNRIATGERPGPETAASALAWWMKGQRQALVLIWRTWPDLVLDLGTNAMPFFEVSDPFTKVIHEGLLALRIGTESGNTRLKKELLWLAGQKRYHEALSRIPEDLSGADDEFVQLAIWLALRTGKDVRALALARSLVTPKSDPTMDQMKLVFGLSLRLGEYVEAVYWGNRMIQTTPSLAGNLNWLNNMAFALARRAYALTGTNASAARQQALNYIHRALSQSRSGPVLHTAAIVYASLSNYQDAAQHIRLALALDTANTNYRALLVDLQKKMRRE